MRLLITGAGGQLGIDLVRCCESAGDDVVATGHADLDVGDRDAVHGRCRCCDPMPSSTARRGLRSTHARAIPIVRSRRTAWQSAGSPRAATTSGLAWCRSAPTTSSTACSTARTTSGTTRRRRACTASSKLAGEREALVLGASAAVVRTSWVCSQNGSNMVRTIMRLADERPELAFVSDQIGHPTFTADLAPMIRRITVDRRSGIHHVTNQTEPPVGTASPATWSRRWARTPTWSGRSRPTSCSRRVRRRVRPTACSTTRCCGAAGIPLLRDYGEPLRETVKALL